MKFKAVMLWSLLGCVGVAMLAGIAAVLLPSRYVDDEVLITIMLVGAYALGGLVVVAIGGRMRWTFGLSAVFTIVSLCFFLIGIWFDRSMGRELENFIWTSGAACLTASITLIHRLLICPLNLTTLIGKIVRRTALISGMLTGAVIVFGFINDGFYGWEDIVVRLMGVSAIVTGGSSIAAGAMALFGPKPGDDEPGLLAGSIPVEIVCPRCACEMKIQSNREGRCEGCRLKVRVEIEEPRCSCGYLLYELESDTCPECGKAIAEADRWQTSASEK